jgi:hypothetical protein
MTFGKNELPISRQLAQQALAKGYRIDRIIEVTSGPDPEAQIIDCYFDARFDNLVVVYDRDIEQPVMTQTQPKGGSK